MSDDGRDRSRDRERTKRDRPSRFSDTNRDRSIDRGGKDRGGKGSLCRVYVSNIPYEYRWQDLKDLFRSQVGDVAFVELFVDDNDKPRGCGIVEFSDPASVKKCLDVMHRFELKGRKLVIKEDFGNQRDKYGNLVGSAASKRARDREENRDRYRDDRRGGFDLPSQLNRSSQDLTDSKWGNTYGLSSQFLDSLGINIPLINRVFVANLDYKVDKKKLKEVFRLAGKVQKTDLYSDRDGKSRGFAVIEYDHPVEAVQAISMFHNQILYDRIMTVRMDREGDRPLVKLPEGLKGMGMGLGLNGEPLRDIARNLPSQSNATTQSSASTGAGILGAVPNMQLGIGGSSALSNLSTNAAVLQAANLAGVGGLSNNLLANNLGGSDLGLAASLVSNPLIQNQSLAALANSGNLGTGALNSSSFSNNENNNCYLSGGQTGPNYQSSGLSQNQNYLGGGGRNFDDQKGSSGFSFNSSNRDNRNTSSNAYSTVNNGNQLLRSTGTTLNANKGGGNSGGSSNKIMISNLPSTASYKMLTEKCNEFGMVLDMEKTNTGSVLVVYSTEWEAERAIKNMDRARIDGRTIDVQYY